MDKTEKALLLELAKFFTADKNKLATLLPAGATPALLGQLLWNRTGGIAFEVLQRHALSGALHPEFCNSLQNAYLHSIAQNRHFFRELKALCAVLDAHNYRYALLNDAWLCGFYPRGCRTCDKIELLVGPKDLAAICETLIRQGFRQKTAPNDIVRPTECGEHICLEVPHREAAPDDPQAPSPGFRHPNIDLRSSLGYPGAPPDMREEMLIQAITRKMTGDLCIRTLCQSDFFIALCGDLYRTATALPYIKAGKDLRLYRFCDVHTHLYILSDAYTDRIFRRAEQFGLGDVCACVILWTEQLLPSGNTHAVAHAKARLMGKDNLLSLVFDPATTKQYRYIEPDIAKRFFCADRAALLKSI